MQTEEHETTNLMHYNIFKSVSGDTFSVQGIFTVEAWDGAIFNAAIERCPKAWWWYVVGAVSVSVLIYYPSAQGLYQQYIVTNLGASAGSQNPIKQLEHFDEVTDLMLSDIIKLGI